VAAATPRPSPLLTENRTVTRDNGSVRISAKTDYAVRAAAELAAASPELWVKTESIATAQGMPLPFLLNILAELRTAGLVQSRRGVDGGYRLARPAGEITVADVIRAVDGPLANIAGARPEDIEYSGSAVALRDTWVALRATMRSVLESVTLESLSSGTLPKPVLGLLDGEDVWQARV
jgi:Rrf2 family protein